ncbi:MAG TPA: ClbS/DfsB family four-helix bundle protein, partial [Anaerolineales bacterium]|nr:ClbS/DfsB family four-helix bundle protein [Anaerolineales bacterium]
MTEEWEPKSKEELFSAIEREWKALMAVISKLDDKQMVIPDAGGWSPKDNLAHLSEWMKSMMGIHLDRRPVQEVWDTSAEVAKRFDIDEVNAIFFERNRDRSTDEVMDELKQVYDRLIAKLSSIPFEDLLKPRFYDDPQKRPVLNWVIGDTSDHFAEHRATLEKSVP